MAIVKVKLMTQYQHKDGTYSVVIYVNAEGKLRHIPTGYAVKKEQFLEGQSNWIRKHPDAVIWNAKIEDKRREVSDCIIPGVGYVEGANKASVGSNFCAYIRKRGQQFIAAEMFDMGYKCTRMALELTTMKGRDVFTQEINMDLIRDYIVWCKTPKKDKNDEIQPGNIHNTIMRKIKNLRTMYNQAITEKVASPPNPFNDQKISIEPSRKQKYTEQQIKSIEVLRLPKDRTIHHVRNAFLTSFYCQGMRFESVMLLEWTMIMGGQIHYITNKGKKPRSINIHPKLQVILDEYKDAGTPYIFPFIKKRVVGVKDQRSKKGAASAQVNEYLKIIGDMAGIPTPLHFHEARHTFANLAKKKGVSTTVIKDSLAHSDEKITEAYLNSLDDDHINDAVDVVYK